METTQDYLTKEERDLLFISLNHVVKNKMDKLGTADQHSLIDLYKKLEKIYPSAFHISKQSLADFLEV
tara:strand:- start:182 stop:385 length:204 start_codon:yes stop_codon:yes gene_type:complete